MIMELKNNISIEQFAAFLDGNLPEDEMKVIETAIDSEKAYSDILGEVMLLDDAVDVDMEQSDDYSGVLSDTDFELPIVPEFVNSSDEVELTNIKDTESAVVELMQGDVHLTLAPEEIESTANGSWHSEAQVENHSSCDNVDMEQQIEDANDLLI